MAKSDPATLPDQVRNDLVDLQYERGDETFDEESVKAVLEKHNVTDIEPGDIEVYKSDGKGISKEVGKGSGFDGAAIHVYNPDKGLNEVYYITRGTELHRLEDPVYDGTGIGGGEITDQIEDGLEFVRETEKSIAKKIPSSDVKAMDRHGDGHSLGEHLIVSLALVTKNFTSVRGLNGAPVNFKQLLKLDIGFNKYASEKGKVGDPSTLSHAQLEKLAHSFYATEAKKITHYRVQGEPMTAQTIPGTFYAGMRIQYIGDPSTPDFLDFFAEMEPEWWDVHGHISAFTYGLVMDSLLAAIRREFEGQSVEEIAARLENMSRLEMIAIARRQKVPESVLVLLTTREAWFKAMDAFLLRPEQLLKQVDLHGMPAFIEAYNEYLGAGSGKYAARQFYQLIDPGFGGKGGGGRILVNLQSLKETYSHLKSAFMEANEIQKEYNKYLHTIHEMDKIHRSAVRSKMRNKETNWRTFLTEKGIPTEVPAMISAVTDEKVVGIAFQDQFDPLSPQTRQYIEQNVVAWRRLKDELETDLNLFQKTMNKLFEADAKLARMFRN